MHVVKHVFYASRRVTGICIPSSEVNIVASPAKKMTLDASLRTINYCRSVQQSLLSQLLIQLYAGIDNGELCCVCQERSINAVELPCKHVFCYLCVKGVAARHGRCALCRAVIPPGYVDRPAVVNKGEIKSTNRANQRFLLLVL